MLQVVKAEIFWAEPMAVLQALSAQLSPESLPTASHLEARLLVMGVLAASSLPTLETAEPPWVSTIPAARVVILLPQPVMVVPDSISTSAQAIL